MNARELMKAPVVSIGPQTSVHDIAMLLLDRHIGGVPVLDKERVVGVVNEFELLQRCELGTEPHHNTQPSWWAPLMRGRRTAPADYTRSHAQHAEDVMTRDVASVGEATPVQEIAMMFAKRSVRRIVVMRGHELVGIITRADLVQALAQRTTERPVAPVEHADEAIQARLMAELEKQTWWRASQSALTVRDGVVHFYGLIESDDERPAARVAAENVPGVRGVTDSRTLWTTWALMN